jgi:hypothetical protein
MHHLNGQPATMFVDGVGQPAETLDVVVGVDAQPVGYPCAQGVIQVGVPQDDHARAAPGHRLDLVDGFLVHVKIVRVMGVHFRGGLDDPVLDPQLPDIAGGQQLLK